ncbi:MAG: sortase [Patescibacteria group bacterium]
MELLKVLANVLIVLGALIWISLRAIWNLVYFAWEVIRDYTPLFAKKINKFLKRGSTSSIILSEDVYPNPDNKVVFDSSWLKEAASQPEYLLPDRARINAEPSLPEKRAAQPLMLEILSKLSLAGMVVSLAILLYIFFPDLVYAVIPMKTEPIQTAVDQSALGGKFTDGNLYSKTSLPEKNEYLPEGNWLVIPKIDVITNINESAIETHESALKKGVWRVPDFADPTQQKKFPTILVAHRYGYIAWSDQFRRQNSFYHLDQLGVGDTFEIIWDHRRFQYEIYAGEEGQQITDYNADIVLYTCKYLNSPVRIFRYARRVEY